MSGVMGATGKACLFRQALSREGKGQPLGPPPGHSDLCGDAGLDKLYMYIIPLFQGLRNIKEK